MTNLKNYILNLNFFQSSNPNNQHNELEQRSNIIATRLCIIIFTVILLILILALWLTPHTSNITIHYPTIDQFEALSPDAQCPCSQISLSYGQFVSVHAKFHQVCSSDFVSDRWIKAIFYGSNSTYFYPADFRAIGTAQFRALASLCQLTKARVLQNFASFNMMLMISPYILSQSVVQSQAQSIIEQIQLSTADTFVKQLEFVRKMIIGNQLFSALQTNMHFVYVQAISASLQVADYMIYNVSNDSYCDCQINVNCRVPSDIFNDFEQSLIDSIFSNNISILMKIDGFSAGCMPMDSILQSTLQCFYNQTCLNKLLSYLSTNENFTAMYTSYYSRFKPNSIVKDIVNELMVEEWITNISYEKYYAQCAPIVCTYLKVERHDFVYVLTKIISLLGGLVLALRFIVPDIVRFIYQKQDNRSRSQTSSNIRFHQLRTDIKYYLVQLNIFERYLSTRRQVNCQRIATRIYMLTFIALLTVLIFYKLISNEIYQNTILKPTEEQFNQLQEIYPTSLSCTCNVISIPYKSFIEIEPIYHQVCSSDMVSQSWIDYYNNFTIYIYTLYSEFRANAGHQFQILETLCEHAQHTVHDGLEVFLRKQLVTSQVISQELFKSQMNASIKEWKSNTLNSFLRPTQLIRITNHGNQLLNTLHNFYFYWDQTSRYLIPIPANYSNCSCTKSSSCRTHMSIFDVNMTTIRYFERFRIPNFFTGCFQVESLLESTLQCFYDKQCMNTIKSYMYDTTHHFSPLDPTRNTPNETVQSIINRLMVDSWKTNISFSDYYNKCAPLSCTFEYTRQHDIFYLISSIFGIFAGLTFGIKIIILIFLRFIEKIIENFSFSELKRRFRGAFISRNEQQITNRCHFILLILTISIFYLVSTLTLVTRTEQIIKPSLSTYQNLLDNYPNSLECPCSHISIEYQTFLSIIPHMHEICSSKFVSNDWIDYIFNIVNPLQLNYTDFRRTAASQYYLLTSLCELSQQVLDDALMNLAISNFINSHLLSSNLLNERIRVLVKEFQMTIPHSFLNSLSLIRQTTEVNMLMNMFSTNWKFEYEVYADFFYLFYTKPLDYEECNCGVSSKCVQSSRGMTVGCYPLESLLQSTFECFYNQTCIDPNNTFQALNFSSNISKLFSRNSTIESKLNQLMVEDYSVNITYKKYFYQCKPISCSYSYVGRRDRIEVALNVIELYGGLAIIARFIVVLFLKLCLYRKREISPQTSAETQ